MKARLRAAAVLALAAASVTALVGAVAGIHNTLTPHVPAGWEGALTGAIFGLLLGGLLGGITTPPGGRGSCSASLPRKRGEGGPLARGLAGGGFGGLLGLAFGVRLPGVEVSAGLLGTLAGGVLGAAVLLLRLPAVMGLLACLWVAGVADPSRLASPRGAPGPLTELPPGPDAGETPLSAYDVTPQPIGVIPPGTVIGDGAPEGWSHLISKSRFQVATGAVDAFPATLADAVGTFFIAFVARVEAVPAASPPGDWGEGHPRHRLAEVALGAGTSIKGRDTIVSGATQSKLGANLGVFGRATLARHERRWLTILVRARSNTMVLVDDPTHFNHNGRNRPVVLRYALLLDPGSGRLETLVWRIDGSEQEGYQGPVGPMEWLRVNQVGQCRLHVDGEQIFLGLPTAAALAISEPPPGRTQLAFPAEVREVAGKLRLTPAEARDLERALWKLLSRGP